ncbi:MAG: hypothetical protein KAI43_08655 [Candidatus Aureabacteria bacterium]|nr:hypothetical protein [Candidatus Auribacterota bacterium]
MDFIIYKNNKLSFSKLKGIKTGLIFFFILATGLFLTNSNFSFASDNEKRIIGIDYGPFRKGQDPSKGVFPSSLQLCEDMEILKHVADIIRIYSVDHGHEEILKCAADAGIEVVTGAWLTHNEKNNHEQIENLVRIANTYNNIPFIVVGNEGIFRFGKGWPEGYAKGVVIEHIKRIKQQVDCPVTTSEPWSIWRDNPDLVHAVDFIFLNIHPYWEEIDIDKAIDHTFNKFMEIKNKYKFKKIIISETGWPSDGDANGASVASIENQKKFLEGFLELAKKEKIDFFFFSAFDEEYKVKEPNRVGPHWGIYFADGTKKHYIDTLKDKTDSFPEIMPIISINQDQKIRGRR